MVAMSIFQANQKFEDICVSHVNHFRYLRSACILDPEPQKLAYLNG